MASPMPNFSSTSRRAAATRARASSVTRTGAPSSAMARIASRVRCLPSRSTVGRVVALISPFYFKRRLRRAFALELRPVRRVRRSEGRAVLDYDLFVVAQRNRTGISPPEPAVYRKAEGVPARRAHRAGDRAAQALSPNIEELPERERAHDRRLDVDDAVGGVRVQPIQAAGDGHDADLRGHLHAAPAVEDLQMRVDVLDDAFLALAVNAVDGQALQQVLGARRGVREHAET